MVEVVALCDVDMGAKHTQKIMAKYPKAKQFRDFRHQIFRQLLTGRKFINISVPFMPTARVIHVGSDSSNIFDDTCIHPSLELTLVTVESRLLKTLHAQAWWKWWLYVM